jgi:hypothetical protein
MATTFIKDSTGLIPTADTSKNFYEMTYDAYLAERDNIPEGSFIAISDRSSDQPFAWQCMPDYSKQETINRMPTVASVWGADTTCFMALKIQTTSASITNNGFGFYINGKSVVYSSNPVTSGTTTVFGVVAIAAGDILTASIETNLTLYSISAFKIPPKFVNINLPRPVIEPGGDYSLDEKPVLINDNGTVRQKRDYDGRAVWEKTCVGNIVATAGTTNTKALMFVAAQSIISTKGWIQVGGAQTYKQDINTIMPGTYISYAIIIVTTTDIRLDSVSSNERTGTTNNAYRITLEYTKV